VEFAEQNQFDPVGALKSRRRGPGLEDPVAVLGREFPCSCPRTCASARSEESGLFPFLSIFISIASSSGRCTTWSSARVARDRERWSRGEIGSDDEHRPPTNSRSTGDAPAPDRMKSRCGTRSCVRRSAMTPRDRTPVRKLSLSNLRGGNRAISVTRSLRSDETPPSSIGSRHCLSFSTYGAPATGKTAPEHSGRCWECWCSCPCGGALADSLKMDEGSLRLRTTRRGSSLLHPGFGPDKSGPGGIPDMTRRGAGDTR